MFRQILLTSSIRNVWRKVKRRFIFISGFKGLTNWYPFTHGLREIMWSKVSSLRTQHDTIITIIIIIIIIIIMQETKF